MLTIHESLEDYNTEFLVMRETGELEQNFWTARAELMAVHATVLGLGAIDQMSVAQPHTHRQRCHGQQPRPPVRLPALPERPAHLYMARCDNAAGRGSYGLAGE